MSQQNFRGYFPRCISVREATRPAASLDFSRYPFYIQGVPNFSPMKRGFNYRLINCLLKRYFYYNLLQQIFSVSKIYEKIVDNALRFILSTFSDVEIQWKQQDQESVHENANDAILKVSSYFRKAEQEYRDTLYKLGSKDLSPRGFHCPRNQGVRERPNKNCGGKNLRRRKDDRVTPISAGHEQHGGHQPRRFTDQENGFEAVEKPPQPLCVARLLQWDHPFRCVIHTSPFPWTFLLLKSADTPISSLVPFLFFVALYLYTTTKFLSLYISPPSSSFL